MESPPAKRQRTDDDASSKITRVEKFWFKDGNIILQVESSQYRVHKSLLALHSNTFKNLFDVPQPEHEPLVEGCQVVHLSDSAQDMEHIVFLIYEGLTHVEEWQDLSKNIPIFRHISAMIRLGRKYEFTPFQAWALGRLQIQFPKHLEDWLEPCQTSNSAHLFNVINLAHETSITTILPAVYLDVCLQCTLEQILHGVEDIDNDKLVRLNPHSMELCIIGREKLYLHIPRFIFPWLSHKVSPSVPCRTCTDTTRCKKSFMEFMRRGWIDSMDHECGVDFLIDLGDLSSFCAGCKGTIVIEYEKGRKNIWNEIPGYFGLPKWDDLKDFEAA